MNANFADFESVIEQSRKALGRVVELGELTAKTVEELARRQFDVAGDYVDFQMQQLQLLGEARDFGDLTEVMGNQTRLATEFGGKVKEYAEGVAKTAAEAQKAYADWATTAFQVPAAAAAPKSRGRKKAA